MVLAGDKLFTPTEDIDDYIALGFVDYMAEKLEKDSSELWMEIGIGNVKTFSVDYPAFF